MNKFIIKDLTVEIDKKIILDKINMELKEGEVNVLLGPNGSGKSTLATSILKHPKTKIIEGDIFLNNKNLTNLKTHEIAREKIFLAFQNPAEVKGLNNDDFLKAAIKANNNFENINTIKFALEYEKEAENLMLKNISERNLNYGFSGGEKKKNEILQLKMLKPLVAIIDETDSGLDVDALKIVGNTLNELKKNMIILIISHNDVIFKYLKPDQVFIIKKGQIVKKGNSKLIEKVNKEGFEWI